MPTETPVSIYRVKGEIKGINGRKLTASEKLRLAEIPMYVVVKDSSGNEFSAPVNSEFTWVADLTEGGYSFKLISDGDRLTITSKPVSYKVFISNAGNAYHFAVRLKNSLGGANDGASKKKPKKVTKKGGK